jgi:hypothetical protein
MVAYLEVIAPNSEFEKSNGRMRRHSAAIHPQMAPRAGQTLYTGLSRAKSGIVVSACLGLI